MAKRSSSTAQLPTARMPGSGGLMNLAIFRRDIPVLSATILVLATIFVVINILVDVLQALIDARMRR